MARAPRRRRLTNEIATWGAELPDEFLTCRDLGHTWRSYTASWDAKERVYRRSLQCARCHSERRQTISQSGQILGGHYVYADGYSKPAGTGYLDAAGRGALRLESVLREIDHADTVDVTG